MPARNYSKISVDKAKTIKRKKYNNSTELKHLHYETWRGNLGRPSWAWMGILLNRLQFCASFWASFNRCLRPHLSWLHARYKLSGVVWTAVTRGVTSRSHTLNIEPAVRKNSSPKYWIFTSVLVGSSPRSSLLGWFCNRTGTSVNDDARKSNNWLDQWHSGKLSTESRV